MEERDLHRAERPAPPAAPVTAWNPWRPPPAGPAAADAALHADLMRHFAATSLDAGAALEQITAFDLNAAAPAGDRLSEDPLLDAVFAGAWVRAVGHFRAPVRRPAAFVAPPPFPAASVQAMDRYGAPALVRAVFDATAAARAVAPARPEIEFLHAWTAFHLDPDLAGPPPPDPPDAADWAADYRIDVDDAVVLEVLERAAALAPDDPLFADALRVVARLRGR